MGGLVNSMAKTPEAKVRDPVVAQMKALGVLHFRNHMGPGVRKARPDDEFVYEGKVAFYEFKAPGKKPTKLQEYVIEQLRAQHVPANWGDDSYRAVYWLRMVLVV